MRPSVAVGSAEVLFREVVANIGVDMKGNVELNVESDSYDGDAAQDVNVDVDFDTTTFTCDKREDAGGVVTYEKSAPQPITPNSVMTLCVTGQLASVRYMDIEQMLFTQAQPQGLTMSEARVQDYLTQKIFKD